MIRDAVAASPASSLSTRSSEIPEDMTLQRATHAPWLAEADAQLDAIEHLTTGWGGQGAGRPDPELIQVGRELLESLASEAGIPKPHVNPTPSGGVQFEWESASRYFEVEVVGPDQVNALYQDVVTKEQAEWERPATLPVDDLRDYIRRVAERA